MGARFAPNEKRRAELARLVEYGSTLAHGARVSWLEVEQATGVSMRDDYGRDLFREAVREKLKRRYVALPGFGIEMSSPENANEIASREIQQIGSAVDRAGKTTGLLIEQHLDKMQQDQQARLLQKQAFLATIALSGNLSKRLPAK